MKSKTSECIAFTCSPDTCSHKRCHTALILTKWSRNYNQWQQIATPPAPTTQHRYGGATALHGLDVSLMDITRSNKDENMEGGASTGAETRLLEWVRDLSYQRNMSFNESEIMMVWVVVLDSPSCICHDHLWSHLIFLCIVLCDMTCKFTKYLTDGSFSASHWPYHHPPPQDDKSQLTAAQYLRFLLISSLLLWTYSCFTYLWRWR